MDVTYVHLKFKPIYGHPPQKKIIKKKKHEAKYINLFPIISLKKIK